jgi:hypothetical protein
MNDESDFVTPVVRLTFRVRLDGTVQLIDQQRLAMAFVPMTDDPGDDPPVGFWHELRDQNDRVVHRRLMRNPLSNSVEVPTGNPNEPLAYRTAQPRRHLFFVDVPDLPEARSVALVEGRPRRRRPAEPARAAAETQRPVETREVARFTIEPDDEHPS